MTAINMPDGRLFTAGYPQIQRSVSASRSGNKAMAYVEYADAVWIVQMKTIPLQPEERLALETFKDAARDGLTTILYTPHARPLPRAYWNDQDNPVLDNTGALVSVTGGTQLAINSVDNGLILGPGDLISLSTGDYNSLFRIQTGGTSSGNAIGITVEPEIPSYITAGAVVRFKNPVANMRVAPGSFAITDDFFPVASFTLNEIAK